MVDALDSKSSTARCVGSSPTSGTNSGFVRPDPPAAVVPTFCAPDLEAPDIRKALVRYFGAHADMGATPLLDAGPKAFSAIWPGKGGVCS